MFRHDINGLRALAVLGVLVFHFDKDLLPGGFSGVDAFFVISGYLMTGIIFRGIENKNFSTLNFYMARANRIIPPLAVLCFALLVFGYFFMLSMDYKTLGRDVATSMFFVSNVMFSLRKGYFEFGDNYLLHTWSLSAEWQFYLIYPLLIMALCKAFSLNNIKRLLVGLCVIGFIFGVYASIHWPTAAYFLLGARAWEMLLGGLVYLYPISLSKGRKRTLEISGILMLVGSYFAISGKDLWPGYLALFPTIGTALVIISSNNEASLLRSGLLQKLGLWSYSIYLWHWPVAVAFSYYDVPSTYIPIGMVVSVLLGYLSYALVETRRFSFNFTFRNASGYAAVALVFALTGAYIFQTQGIAYRNELLSNSMIQGGTDNDYRIHEGITLLNTENTYDYLLLGDSNANHYVRGIRASDTRVKLSWWGSCLSYPNVVNKIAGFFPNWKEVCHENHRLAAKESKTVIIAQSYKKPDSDQFECLSAKCSLSGDYLTDLEMLTHRLLDSYGSEIKVVLVGELPKPSSTGVMRCLRRASLLSLKADCNQQTEVLAIVARVNDVLDRVAQQYENVTFIDPSPVMCQGQKCNYVKEGKSIFYTDGEHLSGYGSELVWKFLIDKINLLPTSKAISSAQDSVATEPLVSVGKIHI